MSSKEKPILVSPPLVRAYLAGQKWQTRRIVQPRMPEDKLGMTLQTRLDRVLEWRLQDGRWYGLEGYETLLFADCRYGQTGDKLWVRETLTQKPNHDFSNSPYTSTTDWVYLADDTFLNPQWSKMVGWSVRKSIPSIHMPRWASRLTLDVVDVRVERLQVISEKDAEAEGMECRSDLAWGGFYGSDSSTMARWAVDHGHRAAFKETWIDLNGEASWNKNPWVWVVETKRIESK